MDTQPVPVMKIGLFLEKNSLALQRGMSSAGITLGILAGVYLRYSHYAANRSLWLDTAALAVNMIEKSYAGLLTHLDLGQHAPPGFLLVSKFIGSRYNYNELALTAFPFFCSLLSLFLFLYLCFLVLEHQKIALAFLPFALSTTAIYYAGEFKQYSVDLFFSVLLVTLAVLLIRRHLGGRYLLGWALAGLVSVWFSHPAIIVLSGVWLAVFLTVLLNKESASQVYKMLTIGVVWVLDYLIFFYTVLYPSSLQGGVNRGMSIWFARPPVDGASLRWYVNTFFGLFQYPLGFDGAFLIASVCFLIGIVVYYQKRRDELFIFSLPLLILMVVSFLGRYPVATGQYEIYSRWMLFTIPLFYIFIAEGASYLADQSKSILIYGFIFLLLLFYLGFSLNTRSFMHEETRPLIEYYYQNREGNDDIYVYASSVPAFRYYNRLHHGHFIEGKASVKDLGKFGGEVKDLVRGRRIWFLFSHVYGDEECRLVSCLDSIGTRREARLERGASLYCYDFSAR